MPWVLVPVRTGVAMFALLSSPVFSNLRSGVGGSGKNPITGPPPQAQPSEKGIGVVARPASSRQLFQLFDIASSQNYVVGLEGGNQSGHYVRDMTPPLLLAPFF